MNDAVLAALLADPEQQNLKRILACEGWKMEERREEIYAPPISFQGSTDWPLATPDEDAPRDSSAGTNTEAE